MVEMEKSALLLGLFAITACSLDHVVVAALDDAGAAGAFADGAGGSMTNERQADPGAGAGGVAASGGSRALAGAGASSITLGGAVGSVLLEAGGAAGATTEIRCSCLGQQPAEVCGTDGLTYPTECSDAGPCFPPAIDCWHACPCLDAGSDGMGQATWFPLDCVASAQCSDNVVCMKFSNVVSDGQTLCATAN